MYLNGRHWGWWGFRRPDAEKGAEREVEDMFLVLEKKGFI